MHALGSGNGLYAFNLDSKCKVLFAQFCESVRAARSDIGVMYMCTRQTKNIGPSEWKYSVFEADEVRLLVCLCVMKKMIFLWP